MYLEIANPTDYHAALYIRLSKEDENEGPSGSVTNQQSLLNAFVREHRLAVYDTYIDDGWSGTSFDRPGFQRMLRDIEAGKVNMVITKDLSRLGRDYIMTGHYMERYFPEKRVRYISLLDGVDTGVESSANDITPFRAIMNDMYARDISRKIKAVKHDKQRKGEFIGASPCTATRCTRRKTTGSSSTRTRPPLCAVSSPWRWRGRAAARLRCGSTRKACFPPPPMPG